MSRFSQYNKNDTYRDNYNYANIQKERRTNEELQEIERDRKAMERLQIELDQEKKLEKERKNQIRQQQYEDYSNYMRQKYSETPQNKENINIKLGGEQRFIRKPSYNQQMDNLCLNPTRQANIYPSEPFQNFSEAGRNYQRGYSHGYNILTGESFSPQQIGKTPKNVSNNSKNLDLKGYNLPNERPAKTEYPKENQINEITNKEKEELSQYQAYMEMKRQKEQEEMYYLEQQEKEKNRQLGIKNIEPNNQLQSQPPQKYNELNQKENYEQMRINQNEIPPEYREMYMKQQLEQQQKPAEQQQEIPPEYREIYLRQQMEQERQKELQQKEQEIPPEYREMYLRQQMEQERQKELQQKEQEIPPEYREMYLRQQMEKEQQKELQKKGQDIPPQYREMYLREQNQKQQQNPNIKDEKNQFILQQKEEMPNEYEDIIKQQNTQKHERSTPYNIKNNNYINPPNYYNDNNPKNDYQQKTSQEKIIDNTNIMNNNNNKSQQEQISEKEYKDYLLSQQNNKEKEKEDENMEIYQNMLREQEKEKLQNNTEREQYLQYLLNQQNQNPNQIKEPNLTNKSQYQEQYEEKPEIRGNPLQKQDMVNELNNKPINSFEEYYKQKGINVQEPPKSQMENPYENYALYPKEEQKPNSLSPQEQGFSEQEYLMYQKQKQMQEMQEMEERERARQILERQQMGKMNLNNINQENEYQIPPSSYNSPYNNQIQISERKSEFNSARMEYLQNKKKNRASKDNIFSVSEIPKPPPKYNNEPLTNAERLRIQREYAQFLDAQINAKNIKNSKNKNNGLGPIQNTGYEVGGPNPYQQLRDKHNKLKDIPQDPYSVKNYNISNNSYLTSNPITNPVNSYKFVDRRRVSSGRLQNNGSNIVGK